MNTLLKATISDLLLIVGGISMLFVPLSTLIWLIRKLLKKATKSNKIWTIIFTAVFIVFESIGMSLRCDHSYQLTQTIPPTNSTMGMNTYICRICGNKTTTELDQLTYYNGPSDPTSFSTTAIKSNITGTWECASNSSYDGTSIRLTITQQNDALIFERKADSDSEGFESSIVFIINEFNDTSAFYEDTGTTYLRVDNLLYEVTASDNVNIFTFDGAVVISEDPVTPPPSRTHSSNGNSSYNTAPSRKRAMTAEEADKLRGTGYHGTRPGSPAEHNELRAAQNTCKECGYHSDNGANSICDYCYWKQKNSN